MIFLLLPGVFLLYLSDVSCAEPSPRLSGDNSNETLFLLWFHKNNGSRNCLEFRINGCKITGDRSVYNQADAVLFWHPDVIRNDSPFPLEQRPPGQKWIWFNLESPERLPELVEYEGIYNLTMTYREDSDIFLPYGYLMPNVLRDEVPQTKYVYPLDYSYSPRPFLVSWVVSHWEEQLERVRYYKLLKEHIKIDVYGRGGTPLPRGADSVVEMIKQYRFYLAMENSQYTDYITEKLWNAVRGGAIPVVLGPSRRNYERFLPPEAFIHVDDFPTVQDLAQYLLKVKDSPSMIQMRLSWRKHYSVYIPPMFGQHVCTACNAVKMSKGRNDVVKNLTAWFLS